MVFDKSVSDPANITISEDFDFLYRLITSGFYRVLCKSAMGGGEVFVCRLDDNDSNFYLDGSPATTTGSSNATGGADTKNESSKYVCGLGLEGVFGGICEWVEGVEINNRVWKITDPDGSTRNVNAETFSGWIINIAAENGPFFDVVPTQVGGSDSTHYSDYYSRTSDSSLVLARSGYRSYPTGGVAYADAAYDASDMDSSYGSRLAFHGTISELAPRQFKRLPVL